MTLQSWTDESRPQQLHAAHEPRTTRERILVAAHDLFQQHGFGRVSVDSIAETAGVTKRTLYHYFRSKDDLLAEIAGMQSARSASHLRKAIPPSADAGAFVDELFGEIAGSNSIERWTGVGFTRIALELTHLPGHPARTIARRHKVEMEAWLSEELRARDIRDPSGVARDLMVLLEGCLLLIITHGDRTYADRAAGTARLLVEASRRTLTNAASAPSSLA